MQAWQAGIKRLIDVVLGLVAAAVLLPVAALIALAVVMDSSGPAIYGARRVGRGGREFTMLKFRSMAKGAEAVGPGVTGAYDYRITRVGAFVRRTKLDELPQLLNVLRGQMSLVGPRPEAPRYVAHWTEEEREVLQLRPGITGPTQIAYIDEEDQLAGPDAAELDDVYATDLMHAKLAIDLEYVRRYSMWRDLVILWQTMVRTLSTPGQRSGRARRRYTLGERLRSARPGPMLLDAALAATAAILAVGLRIDRNNIFAAAATYWVFIPLAAIVRPLGFLLAGAYLRVWRYPTVSDMALVLSSLAVGSLVMTLAIFVVLQPWSFPGTVGFPRSAIVIELLISLLVLGGIRVASRVRQQGLDLPATTLTGPPRPVVIYGAGDAGAALAREMLRNRALRLEPVGFLDDDETMHGRRVYGVEVLGGWEDLPEVVADRDITEVIIAMPRATGAALRRIVTLGESLDIAVRTLPAVQELLDQTVAVSQIRQISVADLLRREQAEIPDEPARRLIEGKYVMVTGAGGSIGAEVSRQVANLSARRVLLLDRAETPLFWIDNELRRRFPHIEVCPLLGDVTDEAFVDELMRRERPDVLVHAAAHKHVPLSEANVESAVLANIRGTRIVLEAAARQGTPAVIVVSTDKAVAPTSVMGATKRWGERLAHEISGTASGRYVVVRFGNVLGSQGSVTELFARQIAEGGPVTVTHPDMARYFMIIPEAVRLILLAGAVGESGEVYVLQMGEPVRIADLAHDVIRLTAPVGHQIGVEFVGLRPGERLKEILFDEDERPEPTAFDALVVARGSNTRTGMVERALHLEELATRGMTKELRDELFRD